MMIARREIQLASFDPDNQPATAVNKIHWSWYQNRENVDFEVVFKTRINGLVAIGTAENQGTSPILSGHTMILAAASKTINDQVTSQPKNRRFELFYDGHIELGDQLMELLYTGSVMIERQNVDEFEENDPKTNIKSTIW
jgi:hypothetical protein